MSKYSAVRTTVDGITFASKKEAARYGELKLLERAGKISALRLQPKFLCRVNGKKICYYIADFEYLIVGNGIRVTEDVKGMRTQVYRLKKNLVEALFPVHITEV